MFGMCLPTPVISHPASPLAIGHTICLCSQHLNYVFPFDGKKEKKKEKEKRYGALGREQQTHI